MSMGDRNSPLDGHYLVAAAAEQVRQIVTEGGDENLDNFDPTQEGGGDPCAACGRKQDPWRYSRYCQGCVWDGLADLDNAATWDDRLTHAQNVGEVAS